MGAAALGVLRARLLILVQVGLPGLVLIACAPNATQPLADAAGPRDADKLYIVDCLLPGELRKVGGAIDYIAPRRPVKTTAVDCEVRGGEYTTFNRADYATALKVWLPKAQEGDLEAQTYVGEIYERGLGAQPDYVVAAMWYQRAADKNFSRAQINLGHLYEQGRGVERDLVKAMAWYRRASGLTDKDLQFVSSVEIAAQGAQEQELGVLRVTVAQQSVQIDKLNSKLAATASELARAREQFQNDKNNLESDRKRLRDELDRQRQQPSPAQAQRIQQLKQELGEREQALATQQVRLQVLEQDSSQTKSQLAALGSERAQQLAVLPPRIELIDPPLSLTRGVPTVLMRSTAKQRDISGRIRAPAGVLTFNVNNRIFPVEADGSFHASVEIVGEETLVSVVAVDKKARTALLEFVIAAPAASALVSVSAAPPVIPLQRVKDVKFGDYYALIIGNNVHKNLPQLKTAISDARSVDDLLRTKYGFKTTLLLNADRYKILSSLNALRQKLTEKDNLVVYYAGHGELDRVNDRGHWLPTDAATDDSTNWISNTALTDILNTMQARHVLVVADSCYSGALSRASLVRDDVAAPSPVREKWLRAMTLVRSRTALTSGGLAPVLDEGTANHSIFAAALLEELKKNKAVLEGFALYQQVLTKVSKAAAAYGVEQTPEYAPIQHAGHESGEFFFVPLEG